MAMKTPQNKPTNPNAGKGAPKDVDQNDRDQVEGTDGKGRDTGNAQERPTDERAKGRPGGPGAGADNAAERSRDPGNKDADVDDEADDGDAKGDARPKDMNHSKDGGRSKPGGSKA
jgi:hypothetical protein